MVFIPRNAHKCTDFCDVMENILAYLSVIRPIIFKLQYWVSGKGVRFRQRKRTLSLIPKSTALKLWKMSQFYSFTKTITFFGTNFLDCAIHSKYKETSYYYSAEWWGRLFLMHIVVICYKRSYSRPTYNHNCF